MGERIHLLSGILIIISAALLLFSFFFPLWRIELWPPQYPEGIFMYIWSYKITGDLRTVNILNHYIGMKSINPAELSELKYFPFFFSGMSAFAVFTVILGRSRILHLCTLFMFLFASSSMGAFYLKNYEYAHNLSADAAIKVEGESYHLPLLGRREILNIEAISMPEIAGYAFTLAVLLSMGASAGEVVRARRRRRAKNPSLLLATCLFLFLNDACSAGGKPEMMDYAHDSCDHCKMAITDSRFGGELVSEKGKILKFDAVECMLNYQKNKNHKHLGSNFREYVSHSFKKGEFILVTKAFCVIKTGLRSPMGEGILCSDQQSDLQEGERDGDSGKEIMKWRDLLQRLP